MTDIATLQASLVALGHDPGPVDGLWGRRTRAAMLAAVTGSGDRLTPADVQDAADLLRCTPAHVRAVCDVEAGRAGGFDPATNRPLILYEPHIFSRETSRRFDGSHPTLSYRAWKTLPYPKTQAARYDQLLDAMALDASAALRSASWGLFQIMGFNHAMCGYTTALRFAVDHGKSEREHLLSFVRFVGARGIADELRRSDWRGFARAYNGPGQVDVYAPRLAQAFARRTAEAA